MTGMARGGVWPVVLLWGGGGLGRWVACGAAGGEEGEVRWWR